MDGSPRRNQGRQDEGADPDRRGRINGPYLATGKHNFVLKVMGESIARKLGNAVVAPILTLEPGRPDGERVAPGSVVLSQATYRAVLTDMAESLRGMGFTNVILMGDSGGNQGAMKEVAAALNTKYNGKPSQLLLHSRVLRLFVGAEADPGQRYPGTDQDRGKQRIRWHSRRVRHRRHHGPPRSEVDSHRAAQEGEQGDHNGVNLLPIEKTLEMGKKIVELRTKLTVDGIAKAMAAASSV